MQKVEQSGLEAFLSLSKSSRRGDRDAIGHKGLGVKSYFLSDSSLIVVTKTLLDADWSCLHISNPKEWLSAKNPQASPPSLLLQCIQICLLFQSVALEVHEPRTPCLSCSQGQDDVIVSSALETRINLLSLIPQHINRKLLLLHSEAEIESGQLFRKDLQQDGCNVCAFMLFYNSMQLTRKYF